MRRRVCRCLFFFSIMGMTVTFEPVHALPSPANYAYPAPGAKSLYKKAMKESDMQKRVQILKQSLAEKPDYVDALREIGLAYTQLKDYTNAEKYLLQAYKTNASDQKNMEKIFLLSALARIYENQGQFQNAEESLRGAIGLALKTDDIWRLNMALAKNLSAQEKFSDALIVANKANDATTVKRLDTVNLIKNIEGKIQLSELYRQAVTAQDAGKSTQAKELFTKVMQSGGTGYKDVAARLEAVNSDLSHLRSNQILESVYHKALNLEQSGAIDNAIQFYQNINLEGGYKDSKQRYANLVKQKSDAELTMKLERLYSQGLAAEKGLKWIEATIAFEEIISINPKYKDSQKRLHEANRRVSENQSETLLARYYAEGIAAKKRKDFDKARTLFIKISKINPQYEDAKVLLEEIDAEINELKLANPRKDHQDNPELKHLYTRAENEIKIKNWRRAIIELEKIQIIDKGYRGSDTLLTYCKKHLFGLDEKEQKKEKTAGSRLALTFVISCIVLIPFLGYIAISPGVKARLYLARKNYTAAAAIYERILQKHPNRIRVLPMLAQIYLLAGRCDNQALKVYKMIMQLNLCPENQPQISTILTQNYLTESQTADADGIHLLEEALASEFKKNNEENS